MRSSGKAPLSATHAASANSQPDASAAAPKPPPALHPLSAYGLLPSILEAYAARGITSLFGWQAAALATPGVLEEALNLLYTAPTSGGKTVVAEVLALRRLQEGGASTPVWNPRRASTKATHPTLSKSDTKSSTRVDESNGLLLPSTRVEERSSPQRASREYTRLFPSGIALQAMGDKNDDIVVAICCVTVGY